MQVLYGHQTFNKKSGPLSLALGNFDGVHLGHQTILKGVVEEAKAKGGVAGVYTFHPHPARVLARDSGLLLIQPLELRLERFRELGLDICILESFTLEFAQTSPKIFFQGVLQKALQARSLWVGYDFTFGFQRQGSVSLLKFWCQGGGVDLHIVPAQFHGQTLISSSRIRELILQGRPEEATILLGRPFALIGRVVKGAGIGTQLGIHTANLKTDNELIPKVGIYITQTILYSEDAVLGTQYSVQGLPSVTSVGTNPTFPGKGFSIETHLIDFEGDLVGQKIRIDFLKWLREERVFKGPQDLAGQIRFDIEDAKKFHSRS